MAVTAESGSRAPTCWRAAAGPRWRGGLL